MSGQKIESLCGTAVSSIFAGHTIVSFEQAALAANVSQRREKVCVLTVGVIARNGLPYLKDCLAVLPTQIDQISAIDVILIDSGSTDETCDVMLDYAAERAGTRVFRIEGRMNAAVARNVVLEHARPGHVLLVDGDTVLSEAFVAEGLRLISDGRALAVSGGLDEIQHGGDGHPTTDAFCRLRVPAERAEHGVWACGTILLGASAVAMGIRYDESLKQNEDRDFVMRLAARGRVRNIPVSMGCHLTRSYYAPERLRQFYRDASYRWLGLLVRKHALDVRSPDWARRLLTILQTEKGVFLGLAYQAVGLGGAFSAQWWLAAAMVAVAAADGIRFARQDRWREFLPLRVFGPWMVVGGLIAGRRAHPSYTVRQLV